MKKAPPTNRQAVVHRNLVLVRTVDEEQMDSLLARAAVRTLLVRRVSPEAALFPRNALASLRRRLDEMGSPLVIGELPRLANLSEGQA